MTVPRGLLNFCPKKSHLEILAILAFLMADCFLSGWTLIAGALLAIFYVAAPALRTMWSQTAAERIIFLKAYVKTSRVQKVAIILFWLFSIRWILAVAADCNLFSMPDNAHASLTNIFIHGAIHMAPIAFLLSPVLIYLAACIVAVCLRSSLKPNIKDPDLIRQRSLWVGWSQIIFSSAFLASVLSITLYKNGPVSWIAHWLIASSSDANMNIKPGFVSVFTVLASLLLIVLFWQPALKLNAFLTSFTWRVVSIRSLENLIESFLTTLHLPANKIIFKETKPLLKNACRTVIWLTACYVVLFSLFAFCRGDVGACIESWMIASGVDAGIDPVASESGWLTEPNYRIFIASMIALYGAPLFAVFCTVFLPFSKPRNMVLDQDGVMFLRGPYFSLGGRQYRIWSDLKSITIDNGITSSEYLFTLKFLSGGSVKVDKKQITPSDLKLFLNYVEQYAVNCEIGKPVFEKIKEQELENPHTKGVDKKVVDPLSLIRNSEFKSTIFTPLEPGDYLPGTGTRIIKQLASKPLCAVYLARNQEGRMVNVKQFYLAEETEETKAFSKILKREFELLSGIDHPGMAKVLNCFTVEHSTYLVIEHRPGVDLRELVKRNGPRSENVVKKWACQIAEIMIYLHNREPAILHRDLTPDNIITGEDGQLRLIDFGAAREFLEGVTGTMIGKQCYVPPEQLRGEADQRSDIYAFGCTLFYLLTGNDPVALAQSSPSATVDCSLELNQLIKECTEFEADSRPRSFEEVLERLEKMNRGFQIKFRTEKKETMVPR